MLSHKQDHRFTFTPACGTAFDVIEFTLDEALSETYRLVLEPPLARAALCSDWRIYQHLSVPEILADVIKRQGITDYEQVTTFEHLPREYCEGFLTMQKDMRMDGVYIEWMGDKK